MSQPQAPTLAALLTDYYEGRNAGAWNCNAKPIYDEWKGIKWKGKRENFEREHGGKLRTFHMARRKLDKHRSPAGKIPSHA